MRYAPMKEQKKKKINLDGNEDDFPGGSVTSKTNKIKIEEVPRADGLWTFKEALAESLICCVGPLGFLGLGGVWFTLFSALSGTRMCYHSKIVDKFDEKGARKVVAKTEGAVDSREMLKSLPRYDQALDKRYSEELRCCISFTMALINSCDSRLKVRVFPANPHPHSIHSTSNIPPAAPKGQLSKVREGEQVQAAQQRDCAPQGDIREQQEQL